jgi:hypothetical protein
VGLPNDANISGFIAGDADAYEPTTVPAWFHCGSQMDNAVPRSIEFEVVKKARETWATGRHGGNSGRRVMPVDPVVE